MRNIVCAWPERASGPGWANWPLWYIYRDEAGKLHEACLQPDEQSHEIKLLYPVAEEAHRSLLHEVNKVVNK